SWQSCFSDMVSNFFNSCSVEDWRCELDTEFQTSPTKNSFIDLPKVHTAWYTEWVQYNINWGSVLKEWHVFSTNNLSNNTFISVTACHLISHFQLTLHREINFREFQYTCW